MNPDKTELDRRDCLLRALAWDEWSFRLFRWMIYWVVSLPLTAILLMELAGPAAFAGGTALPFALLAASDLTWRRAERWRRKASPARPPAG